MRTREPREGTGLSVKAGSDCTSSVAGLRVLVVEDVGMVAMALKSLLEELSCVVVGTPARLREAEAIARTEDLDGVLLDLNLGGEYSYPVIEILRTREIPFIIMSGYDVAALRPELANEPQMQKPFDRAGLEALVSRVFRPSGKSRISARRAVPAPAGGPELPARKTRGEIESAVCQGMSRFEQEYLGRGPKDVRAHLMNDLLVVRLQGVLTAAEQHLAETQIATRGRDLIKQVRTQLIESARPQIESMIQILTGVSVISLHHDISTLTGEEVVIFTLDRAPICRELKNR